MTPTPDTRPTITEQRRQYLREIGRRGGLTRAKSFTREWQQQARARVSHESNVANGREGGKAYVRKHGVRHLVEIGRQYRLSHPSELEIAVEAALIEAGVTGYEREAYLFQRSRCQHSTGDFVVRAGKFVIYADGAAWHATGVQMDNGKALHPSLADCFDRRARDEKLDAYVMRKGWHVLRLSEVEIKAYKSGDNGAMVERIKIFMTEE